MTVNFVENGSKLKRTLSELTQLSASLIAARSSVAVPLTIVCTVQLAGNVGPSEVGAMPG